MKQFLPSRQSMLLIVFMSITVSAFCSPSFEMFLFNAAGTLSDDQTVCAGSIPNEIVEVISPTIPGPYQYQWMQATPSNPTGWTEVPGATSISFTPPAANSSILYTRCVRTAGQPNFIKANPVLIDTDPMPITVIAQSPATANVNVPIFVVAENSPSSTFHWDFGDGQTCIGQACSNNYEPTGNLSTTYDICLTVTTGANCSSTTCETVTVVDAALPVELMYFEAFENNDQAISLKWATATETNNSHFILERATDGTHFEELDIIEGQGNSAYTQYYSYLDENPFRGVNYYRLKQVDLDGNFEYFETISVTSSLVKEEISIFPNPASEKINIQITGSFSENPALVIFDSSGKAVNVSQLTVDNSTNIDTSIDLNHLKNGIYFMNIIDNGKKIHSQKLTIFR